MTEHGLTAADLVAPPGKNGLKTDTQTAGLYGRGTWGLAVDTSLLTGLRINRDRVSYTIVDRSGGFHSEGSDVATSTWAPRARCSADRSR